MTKKVVNPSWERLRGELHSPAGVKELRNALKNSMVRKYVGMAESMWSYEFPDAQFEDFKVMCVDTEPEKTLMQSGKGVWFEIPGTGQWHFLPAVYTGGVNIYGRQIEWNPVPIGYNDTKDPGVSPERDRIRNLKLNADNSVLMFDNIYGISDYEMITKAVDALVDDCVTMNNLTILAKACVVFNVPENEPARLLDAKNFYTMLSQDYPAFFRYSDTSDNPETIQTVNTPLDKTIIDYYRHWEDMLLEQLGIPNFKSDKKAQQNNLEVKMQAGEDACSLRRKEKYKFRKNAIDRLNAMAGTNARVISVIDSMEDNREMETSEVDKNAM